MLVGNESSLEREFSKYRASKHDRGDNIGGKITSGCVKEGIAAQQRSSYSSEDCADKNTRLVNGTAKFTAYSRDSEKKLEMWLVNQKEIVASHASAPAKRALGHPAR